MSALRDCGNVRKACEVAGISRRTPYDLRDRHEDFAEAWEDALADAADLLEAEAKRRAYDGVDEPIVYRGEICGSWKDAGGKAVPEDTPGARFVPATVKRYSDPVLLALLRAYNPRFRDSVQHEHKHKGTVKHRGKVEVDIADAKRREFYRALGEVLSEFPAAKEKGGQFLQAQLRTEGGPDAAEE